MQINEAAVEDAITSFRALNELERVCFRLAMNCVPEPVVESLPKRKGPITRRKSKSAAAGVQQGEMSGSS